MPHPKLSRVADIEQRLLIDQDPALLELLDPRRFDKNVEPTREEIDRVMVRRLKTDIRLVDRRPLRGRQ